MRAHDFSPPSSRLSPLITNVKTPARVVFTGGFSHRHTGGVKEFEIEAQNMRGVIKKLDELYPGLAEHLEKETTVAIDGETHEVVYDQPVRPA